MSSSWPGFAERLVQAREESQLSVEAAAQKIGASAELWRQWEAGQEEPSFREGMAICRLLGISPDWALDIKDEDLR